MGREEACAHGVGGGLEMSKNKASILHANVKT